MRVELCLEHSHQFVIAFAVVAGFASGKLGFRNEMLFALWGCCLVRLSLCWLFCASLCRLLFVDLCLLLSISLSIQLIISLCILLSLAVVLGIKKIAFIFAFLLLLSSLLHLDGSCFSRSNGLQFCLALSASVLWESSQRICCGCGSLWGCILRCFCRSGSLVLHHVEVLAISSIDRINTVFFLAGNACTFTLWCSIICWAFSLGIKDGIDNSLLVVA